MEFYRLFGAFIPAILIVALLLLVTFYLHFQYGFIGLLGSVGGLFVIELTLIIFMKRKCANRAKI